MEEQDARLEEKNPWMKDHPWLADDGSDIDETLRYSLDELRIS